MLEELKSKHYWLDIRVSALRDLYKATLTLTDEKNKEANRRLIDFEHKQLALELKLLEIETMIETSKPKKKFLGIF